MDRSRTKKDSRVGLFIYRSINEPRFLVKWALPNYLICLIVYMFAEGVSIRISWWFSVVTGFTVGYGDNFPKTLAGQLISFELIVSSWFVLSIVLVQIFTNHLFDRNQFSHEEQEFIMKMLGALIVQAQLIYQLIVDNHRAKMAILMRIEDTQTEEYERQAAFNKRLAEHLGMPTHDLTKQV